MGFDEERVEDGKVLCVSSRPEDSPELILSSPMCNECELYSDEEVCAALDSVLSSPQMAKF